MENKIAYDLKNPWTCQGYIYLYSDTISITLSPQKKKTQCIKKMSYDNLWKPLIFHSFFMIKIKYTSSTKVNKLYILSNYLIIQFRHFGISNIDISHISRCMSVNLILAIFTYMWLKKPCYVEHGNLKYPLISK